MAMVRQTQTSALPGADRDMEKSFFFFFLFLFLMFFFTTHILSLGSVAGGNSQSSALGGVAGGVSGDANGLEDHHRDTRKQSK